VSFGQTAGAAVAQPDQEITGGIVGFTVSQGGNVDYFGLVVAPDHTSAPVQKEPEKDPVTPAKKPETDPKPPAKCPKEPMSTYEYETRINKVMLLGLKLGFTLTEVEELTKGAMAEEKRAKASLEEVVDNATCMSKEDWVKSVEKWCNSWDTTIDCTGANKKKAHDKFGKIYGAMTENVCSCMANEKDKEDLC